MRSHYALLAAASLLCSLSGRAQVHNALDFDGIDDKVTVPGASALIANGTGITLTCWAYPTNAAPGFPDFDGFAGMRDEFTADFYLLQVSPANNLEARFRNNAGQFFTLEYSGLQLNTWQFLAFTYDGSQLTVYANGVNVATAPANGSITNTAVDLMIGDVYYQGTDFLLAGRTDEVSLWSRGLSQAEVNCIYTNGIDVNANGLQLYYKMDQGTGGGNNAGINSLLPSKGAINGALSGFALNGATSNFVESPDVGNNIAATVCPGETYVFNGQTLSQPGVYGAAYDVGDVCDSIVTLTLANTVVNTQVSLAGGVLTAQASTGSWQWLDCGWGYLPWPGATSQTFSPPISGSYALLVTQNGCSDTSACVNVAVTGISENGLGHVRLFPAPARERVQIDLGQPMSQVALTMNDVNGREVLRKNFNAVQTIDLPLAHLEAGLYFIHIRTAEGEGVYRVVKE
ncbi:MAG: T9SS type A sorting domain-containing protein [Bacteroidetes bacterium]|nr:T9SS type A sorting domain-containing protein [Bacteroidota bacterium]MBS1941576.1 T9SS type A sorting domain-containing protein [Bacteroidota bacterium]